MRTDTRWLGFHNKYSMNTHRLRGSGSLECGRGAPLPQGGSVGWGCLGNSRGMMQSTQLWVFFPPFLLTQPRGQGDTTAEPAAGLCFQEMSLWCCWLGLRGVTGHRLVSAIGQQTRLVKQESNSCPGVLQGQVSHQEAPKPQ